MYTREDAKTAIENTDRDAPPMTSDPRLNFLVDVEIGLVEEDEWDNLKDAYEREVEAYNREGINIEPYDPEELLD